MTNEPNMLDDLAQATRAFAAATQPLMEKLREVQTSGAWNVPETPEIAQARAGLRTILLG